MFCPIETCSQAFQLEAWGGKSISMAATRISLILQALRKKLLVLLDVEGTKGFMVLSNIRLGDEIEAQFLLCKLMFTIQR